MIKSFKDYFIFGSPLLIFLGFANVSVYYSFFRVPIQDYLELSEVITSFLDESIIGASAAAVAAVLMTFLNFKREMLIDRYDEPHEQEKPTKFQRVFNYVKWILPIGMLLYVVIYLIVLPTVKKWNEPYYMEAFFTGATLFLVWLGSLHYDMDMYRKTKSNKHAINIFIVAFSIFLVLISFLQLRSVKYNHGTIGTEVKYSLDGVYVEFVSDSTTYFIGKTQNFVFIFDSKASRTQIIPMDNIEQIVLNIESINPFLSRKDD